MSTSLATETLPADVVELIWLYQEWQRQNGLKVEHPIRKPPGVIDGLLDQISRNQAALDEYWEAKKEPVPRPRNFPDACRAKIAEWEAHIESQRLLEVEVEMRRKHEAMEALAAEIEAKSACEYVPGSIDPVLEAEKLREWHQLRMELGLNAREDLIWLEHIVDNGILDEKAIRWVWKHSGHLRRRR